MMDMSSPLAAMHNPHVSNWAGRRDLPASRLMYSGSQPSLGPVSFDFRAMSRSKSNHDYFSMPPPVRNSSPTVSLAADLSSNFHIDNSPQAPTPRRSLFARDMFLPRENKGLLVTPPLSHDKPTTPPIFESSPAADVMDISPLPHKAPCFVARVTLPSPAPNKEAYSCNEDQPMRSPGNEASDATARVLGPPPVMALSAAPSLERKRSAATLARPSLLKTKMYSTTSVPSHTNNLLPAFQYGQHSSKLCNSSSTSSLSETSISEHAEHADGSPISGAPEMRRTTSLTTGPRCDGSPVAALCRKSTATAQRPRKQVRRSLSMFQHPDEIMNESHDYASHSPMQVQVDPEPYKHKLPHALSDEPDSLPRIQQDTLINVMRGQYTSHYDSVMIVDCRFEYEYEGGHIEGAINYNDKELMVKHLFDREVTSRTLLIFHCEYSVHRAPRLAKFVRAQDRNINAHRYPFLSYPEMYVLEGGYSKFFQQHRTLCYPENYVEMEHKDHELACERGMGKLKQRAKLSRAQTFAFGQHCTIEQSPTSNFSGGHGLSPFSESVPSMIPHGFQKRLASY